MCSILILITGVTLRFSIKIEILDFKLVVSLLADFTLIFSANCVVV